jgi:hypothetical protein
MLRVVVSGARLRPYLAACGGDPGAAARLYAWNIQVSAVAELPFGFWVSLLGSGTEVISAISCDVAVLEMGEDHRCAGDVADLAGWR